MALKNGRTTAALQTILVGSVIPPGVIQAFGGDTVPSGWLLCDGSTASRSTYAGLFAAVGIVHGEGNGTTTFHLPDLRGRFIRGADNMGTGAAGRDPDAAGRTAANTGGATGATVGSVQVDAFKAHNHTLTMYNENNNSGENPSTTQGAASASVITMSNTGGNETRPLNANASYIIKV
jgi:microcystin-dependent protein